MVDDEGNMEYIKIRVTLRLMSVKNMRCENVGVYSSRAIEYAKAQRACLNRVILYLYVCECVCVCVLIN